MHDLDILRTEQLNAALGSKMGKLYEPNGYSVRVYRGGNKAGIFYGDDTAIVHRVSSRKWNVCCGNESATLYSQEDVFSWITDRM